MYQAIVLGSKPSPVALYQNQKYFFYRKCLNQIPTIISYFLTSNMIVHQQRN